MKMPNFLRALMTTPAYMDKNSTEYATAEKYLRMLYPGNVTTDASGRMVAPEYDMTLKEFREAQTKMDHELQAVKTNAENEYYNATGEILDTDAYVKLEENIDVRVLMPGGSIEIKQLEVYNLDLPENGNHDTPGKTNRIWRWHSNGGGNSCGECAARDGEIYESENNIPTISAHPNCQCSITQEEIDAEGRIISVKPYKFKVPEMKNKSEQESKKMTDEQKFNQAYEKLKEPEGGYTDGKNQIKDEPTNMGIKQSTLDNYAKNHPDKDLPVDVKDLRTYQAREIYKEMYWDNSKISQIENDRIRNAVFDMRVMSGPAISTKTLQQTLNEQIGANLAKTGYLGAQTIKAINSIPESKVNNFMNALIENRMQSLQKMTNWSTAKGGWTARTRAY